jgi:hypothetical protein
MKLTVTVDLGAHHDEKKSGTAYHSDSAHKMRVGWMEWALSVAMKAALGGVGHHYIKLSGYDDVPAGLLL